MCMRFAPLPKSMRRYIVFSFTKLFSPVRVLPTMPFGSTLDRLDTADRPSFRVSSLNVSCTEIRTELQMGTTESGDIALAALEFGLC